MPKSYLPDILGSQVTKKASWRNGLIVGNGFGMVCCGLN